MLATLTLGLLSARSLSMSSNWDAAAGVWTGGRVPAGDFQVPRPLYLFGYGSLCWKPQPEFGDSFVASIQGFQRRFAQRSYDHRGTPERPGWTVTCVAEPDLERLGLRKSGDPPSETYGLCYLVPDDVAEQVLEDLDVREKGGYSRALVEEESREPVQAVLYTGLVDNPLFELRSEKEVAAEIFEAVGPSGTNLEYLENLATFLRGIGVDDAHVEALMAEVNQLRAT